MRQVSWKQILGRPSWTWGVVATVTPDLTVTLDTGGTVDVGSCLVAGLVVGDRVYCQREGRSLTVLGKNITY